MQLGSPLSSFKNLTWVLLSECLSIDIYIYIDSAQARQGQPKNTTIVLLRFHIFKLLDEWHVFKSQRCRKLHRYTCTHMYIYIYIILIYHMYTYMYILCIAYSILCISLYIVYTLYILLYTLRYTPHIPDFHAQHSLLQWSNLAQKPESEKYTLSSLRAANWIWKHLL